MSNCIRGKDYWATRFEPIAPSPPGSMFGLRSESVYPRVVRLEIDTRGTDRRALVLHSCRPRRMPGHSVAWCWQVPVRWKVPNLAFGHLGRGSPRLKPPCLRLVVSDPFHMRLHRVQLAKLHCGRPIELAESDCIEASYRSLKRSNPHRQLASLEVVDGSGAGILPKHCKRRSLPRCKRC